MNREGGVAGASDRWRVHCECVGLRAMMAPGMRLSDARGWGFGQLDAGRTEEPPGGSWSYGPDRGGLATRSKSAAPLIGNGMPLRRVRIARPD